MKKVRIPKNQTLIASGYEVEGLMTFDTNSIEYMEDNSHGAKGTPDYYLKMKDGEDIAELTNAAFINIPYKSLKIKFL